MTDLAARPGACVEELNELRTAIGEYLEAERLANLLTIDDGSAYADAVDRVREARDALQRVALSDHINALTAKVEALNAKARENYNEQTSGIDFFDGEFAAYSTVLAILRGE